MSLHGCPRIDDAASYVLRAMPDGEFEQYAMHVDGCEACADTIAELGFVADALLSGVRQMDAPPVIRDRVMSVVHAEAQLLRSAGAMADRPVVKERSSWRLGGFSLRLWPATALACVVLALGIGGGALLTGDDGTTRNVTAKVSAPGATAMVRLSSDGVALDVEGMPAPPAGRIYQVWLDPRGTRGPEPTQVLFSVNSAGRATVSVPGDLDDVDAVLVTDEPLGGSQVPTRQPVIQATLT